MRAAVGACFPSGRSAREAERIQVRRAVPRRAGGCATEQDPARDRKEDSTGCGRWRQPARAAISQSTFLRVVFNSPRPLRIRDTSGATVVRSPARSRCAGLCRRRLAVSRIIFLQGETRLPWLNRYRLRPDPNGAKLRAVVVSVPCSVVVVGTNRISRPLRSRRRGAESRNRFAIEMRIFSPRLRVSARCISLT
jgi:hypothetical protein